MWVVPDTFLPPSLSAQGMLDAELAEPVLSHEAEKAIEIVAGMNTAQ